MILDPEKTNHSNVRQTAFTEAMKTNSSFWEYIEEKVVQADGSVQPRRLHDIFSLAMLGGGRAQGPPLYEGLHTSISESRGDFLTVVCDRLPMGCVGQCNRRGRRRWCRYVRSSIRNWRSPSTYPSGGMSLDLAKRFPQLQFIVQDRPPVLEKARSVWSSELPMSLETERTKLMPHDFFTEQPVKGAAVYLMRYILYVYCYFSTYLLTLSYHTGTIGLTRTAFQSCPIFAKLWVRIHGSLWPIRS